MARSLRRVLPSEDIYYIGDTARVPYGGKSPSTVERYSFELAGLLLAEKSKVIVVACNTASALAVPRMQEAIRVPVVGVIQPGAAAAVAASRNQQIGVIGTRATISSGAYERAIRKLAPQARVLSTACPLLVPLIEEGWLGESVTREVLHRYLDPILATGIDTLVLGCTHYPLLADLLQEVVGPDVTLVDSADNCALAVKDFLDREALAVPSEETGRLRVALTDHSDAFLRVAEKALGLEVGDVELKTVQSK